MVVTRDVRRINVGSCSSLNTERLRRGVDQMAQLLRLQPRTRSADEGLFNSLYNMTSSLPVKEHCYRVGVKGAVKRISSLQLEAQLPKKPLRSKATILG